MNKNVLNEVNRAREMMGLKLLKEYDEEVVEKMDLEEESLDASNIDLDTTVETQEEDWMQEDWDDLDENVQNAYREHKEFKGMDDAAIREKFNAMPLDALCKISRFLFGWVVKLFRGGLSAFDKELRGGMGGKHWKRRQAWRCGRHRI